MRVNAVAAAAALAGLLAATAAALVLAGLTTDASAAVTVMRGTEQQELEKPTPRPKPEACWRNAESRGPGHLPEREAKGKCPAGEEKSGGFCYPPCPAKYEGVGPVCWVDCNTTPTYHSAGLLFCCKDDTTCAELLKTLGKRLPEDLIKVAVDIAANPSNVIKILKDFRDLARDAADLGLPTCVERRGVEEQTTGAEAVVA